MTGWLALVGWMVAGPAMGLAPPAPLQPEGRAPDQSEPAPLQPEGDAPEAAPLPAPLQPEGDVPKAAPEVEPAPLPVRGPTPPDASEPRAWGGAYDTPLPRPPNAVDPSTLTSEPWRGRFWLGIGLFASIPLGGRPPAAGTVISAVGEVDVGWRLRPYLALHTSISSFAHDAGRQTVVDSEGNEVSEVALGRMTAFDLLTARFFVPVPRRIQPWGEVGAGVGIRRGPFDVHRQAAGFVRVGMGVDFWLAPTFTIGTSASYRSTFIGDTVGHGLRAGADLGIHW
jgi:hypothetical protein